MLGLGVDRLQADINRLLASLFHQGVLDEQFLQLQQLQDETSPNFVMDREFSDYKKIGLHLNQLVGSSSSIGARRVRNVCVAFRSASELSNRPGCLRGLEVVEHEYHYLKNMMHELFQLEQQRILAAGVRYPM
ncbi:histidine phosphotransfer protein 6 [Arabidopsis thaliana]|uniref:Histidine-containing phosphotransfer protein n=1 Tax=Arabidopsis thaliana TaxID=3702 RepID=Q104N3_ARATH|nr:histidine phosphotransfer protein 6 [Arabidopsis thaliana]ABA29328.1 AHP6a [Arabidopsis thaliana]AEE36357.1 histidine phosphotransfer protein 6 [Arabidopsis thaliana]|eukprot:NP_001117625.1 histidine phosphotransfer protein 6 [Arabidopsis thaliana]